MHEKNILDYNLIKRNVNTRKLERKRRMEDFMDRVHRWMPAVFYTVLLSIYPLPTNS